MVNSPLVTQGNLNSNANLQNTAISFRTIHFFDRIKLILYTQVRNFITQLTLIDIILVNAAEYK